MPDRSLNLVYSFVPCTYSSCSKLALTGEDYCWDHLEIKENYKARLLDTIQQSKSLSGWVLDGVDFRKTNLANVDFSFAFLRDGHFEGADLSGCCFDRAHLEGANLQGAKCCNSSFVFAILGLADLSGADLTDSNLEMSNLVGSVAKGAVCRDANFFYARPGNADFSGCDFTGANLTRAIFRRANLQGADLRKTTGHPNVENANLEGVLR